MAPFTCPQPSPDILCRRFAEPSWPSHFPVSSSLWADPWTCGRCLLLLFSAPPRVLKAEAKVRVCELACLRTGWQCGTPLASQWLGLHASTARGQGLSPDQGTKIPQALWHGQKQTKKSNLKCALLKQPLLSVVRLYEERLPEKRRKLNITKKMLKRENNATQKMLNS